MNDLSSGGSQCRGQEGRDCGVRNARFGSLVRKACPTLTLYVWFLRFSLQLSAVSLLISRCLTRMGGTLLCMRLDGFLSCSLSLASNVSVGLVSSANRHDFCLLPLRKAGGGCGGQNAMMTPQIPDPLHTYTSSQLIN